MKSEELKTKSAGLFLAASLHDLTACLQFTVHRLTFTVLSLLVFSFSFFTTAVSAQDDTAPPPLKLVTKIEREKLAAQSDIKNRTKLALEMMDSHVDAAEQFNTREDFDAVFRELGAFHGLLENALDFLQKRNNDSGKVLDNFKRLEIGLRSFVPRIETLRREMPPRYEDYLVMLLKNVREARSKAVDTFFDDTVLQQKKTDGLNN